MKQNVKVALGGVIAAISAALMFMTGLFPFATYAIPAVAGAFLIIIVIEIHIKWAALVFVASAMVNFFISPDKEAAVVYAALFGLYPVVKSAVERLNRLWLEWIIKMILFNAAAIGSFYLVMYVFGITGDSLQIFGKYGVLGLLLLGNISFIIYDIALTHLIAMYMARIHLKIRKLFR